MKTKTVLTRIVAFGLAVCLPAIVFPYLPAHAHPTTSPSAVMAVRLKYHPPANWIRHYLGDDRYKVAGNIWKVVSTQMDTYYHRANCPNMLRQPAGTVIGFATASDAEEGGYVADPYCAPQAGSVTYAAGASTQGANSDITNRGRRAIRIVLADGKSTVLLPPNWRRTRTGAQTVLGYSLLSDTLQPVKGGGSLRFAFINAPGNTNVEPFMTPSKFSQLAQLANTDGKNSAAANYLKTAKVGSGRLGGRRGVTLTPQGTTAGAEVRGRVTVAALGSKVYVLENNGGSAGANTVINSFQAR